MIIEPIANSNQQQQNINVVAASEIHFKEGLNKTIKERPVENIGSGGRNEPETTTKTVIDKNKVLVFTRYDEEGNVINEVPPGYVAEV